MPLALIDGLIGTAVTSGTAGVTTQTFDTGMPWTPVAAMIEVSRAVTDATAKSHVSFSQGFTDGTVEAGTAAMSEDGITTSNAKKVAFDDAIIRLVDTAGTGYDAVGSFDAFVAGGVRIVWDTIPSAAYLIHVTLWFGDNVEVKVGVTTPPAIGAGSTTVTTGFVVQHMMVFATGNAFNEALTNISDIQRTHITGSGTSLTHKFASRQWETGKSTSESHIRLAQTTMCGAFYRGGQLPILNLSETHIDEFSATDGFEISSQGLYGLPGPAVAWLAVTYGADNAIDLRDETLPTKTGIHAMKCGFLSWGAMVTNTISTVTTWTDDNVTGESAWIGFGSIYNSLEERSISSYGEDGVSTTNTDSWSVDGVMMHATDNSGTLLYEGDSSFDSVEGVEVHIKTAPATATIYAAFQLERDTYIGLDGGGSFPLAAASGAGDEVISGSGTPSFALAQANAAGEEVFTGVDGGGSFAIATADAVGMLTYVGTSTGTLPLAEADSAGLLTFSGISAGVLPLAGATAVGLLGITGAGTATFTLTQASAVGEEVFTGTAAGTLPLTQASAVGTLTYTCTSTGTLPLAQATGAGLQVLTGTGTTTLPLAEASSVGLLVFTGSSAGTLPLAQATGVGMVPVFGSSAGTLPLAQATGVGMVPVTGVGTGTLPLAEASSAGLLTYTGVGTGTLPLAEADTVGSLTFTGSSAGVLPLAEVDSAGLLTCTGASTGVLPLAEATGTGMVPLSGIGAGIFPLGVGTGTGLLVLTATGVGFFPLATAIGTDSLPLGCTAQLEGSYLTQTNLTGTYETQTNLTGTYETQTDLEGNYLVSTELDGTYIDGTDLTGGVC